MSDEVTTEISAPVGPDHRGSSLSTPPPPEELAHGEALSWGTLTVNQDECDSNSVMGNVDLGPLGPGEDLGHAPSLDDIEPSPLGIEDETLDDNNRAASRGMASNEDPMMPRSVEEADTSTEPLEFNVSNVKLEPLSPGRLDGEESSPVPADQNNEGQGLFETIPEFTVKEEPISPAEMSCDYQEEGGRRGRRKKKKKDKEMELAEVRRDRRRRKKDATSDLGLFGGRRILTLQLSRLELSKKCQLGNGRIDLKALKRSSPGIFKVSRGSNSVSLKHWSMPEPKKRGRPRKVSETIATTSRKKKEREKPQKKVVKVKSEPLISDASSGSDSELEEMRKKLNRKKPEIMQTSLPVKEIPKKSENPVKVKVEPEESSPVAKKGRQSSESEITPAKKEQVVSTSHDDDDDDSDKEQKKPAVKVHNEGEKKKIVPNPLFELKRLIEEREKAQKEEQEEKPEKVKEVLVEKLYNLISGDEKKDSKVESQKAEDDDKEVSKPDDTVVNEASSETVDKIKKEPSKSESSKPSETTKKKEGPFLDTSLFYRSSKMKRFRDVLMMEMGPIPLIVSKHSKSSISEVEQAVKEAVENLERPARVKGAYVPIKPSVKKGEIVYQGLAQKSNVKPCKIVLRDVANRSKYRKMCSQALVHYSNYMRRRDRKRKDILLSGIKLIKDAVSSLDHHRDSKRKKIESDSDSDEEFNRKKKKQRRFMMAERDEDISRIGQFK